MPSACPSQSTLSSTTRQVGDDQENRTKKTRKTTGQPTRPPNNNFIGIFRVLLYHSTSLEGPLHHKQPLSQIHRNPAQPILQNNVESPISQMPPSKPSS